MTPLQLLRVSFFMMPLTIPRGDAVVKQGEQAAGIYFITKGEAACILPGVAGNERQLLHVGPGSTVGERSAMYGTAQLYTVRRHAVEKEV